MAMTTGASGALQSDINVTPMIDVLLVLLIIFMITQPLSRMALDVQVPPPDTPITNKTPPSQI
ncbi:MAG TPA: biopolymer transporter ExbD, partial [Gemmatimonadales bacterium]|nr:biopolymer transporter ExbD [Gemmatimonadales bacterium]